MPAPRPTFLRFAPRTPTTRTHPLRLALTILATGLTIALATGLLAAPAAHATRVIVPSIEDMSAHAALIVVATATHSSAAWQGERIETRTTLTPQLVLHGDAPPTLEVRTPGGRVGDVATRVHGVEVLRPDHTYLLFLMPLRDAPGWQSTALAWGVYELRDTEGTPTAHRQGRGPADDATLPLDTLISRVQGALRAREGEPPATAPESADPADTTDDGRLREGGERLREDAPAGDGGLQAPDPVAPDTPAEDGRLREGEGR